MVKFYNILILLFSFGYVLTGQIKGDYIWITGNNSRSTPGIEAYCLGFDNGILNLDACESILEYDSNNASICDEEGNLLFYTNGCAVADRNHGLMENGDSINAGLYFDLFWEGRCENGYPGFEDILILSDPDYDLGYYIIHKPREYVQGADPSTFMRYLKYSYVDLDHNDGLGKVIEKNIPFFDADLL